MLILNDYLIIYIKEYNTSTVDTLYHCQNYQLKNKCANKDNISANNEFIFRPLYLALIKH